MGWSYNMDRSQTKEDFLARLDSDFSTGYSLIRSQTVGKNHWQLVRRPTGEAMICLCLIDRGTEKDGHGWGYKGISEDMGPVEVNCPLSMLNAAGPAPGEYAEKWRAKVRAYHAKRSERKARPLAPGVVVIFNAEKYRLEENQGRKGWRVSRVSDGRAFRMPCTYMSRAEIDGQPAATPAPSAEPMPPQEQQCLI